MHKYTNTYTHIHIYNLCLHLCLHPCPNLHPHLHLHLCIQCVYLYVLLICVYIYLYQAKSMFLLLQQSCLFPVNEFPHTTHLQSFLTAGTPCFRGIRKGFLYTPLLGSFFSQLKFSASWCL